MRKRAIKWGLTPFILSVAVGVQAAREPVLKGVTLPHAYYWRELYMPQLSSGPSAADFTPDGKAVVYSMAGSLWLQQLDSDTARELTAGPGYDYQPDVGGATAKQEDYDHVDVIPERPQRGHHEPAGCPVPSCDPDGADGSGYLRLTAVAPQHVASLGY